MQIDVKDGGVACSPSAQVTNDPTAIRSLIAVRKVPSFAKPHAGNKLAMSASSDVLEASIAASRVVKKGDITSSPSPLAKSKDQQTDICLPWVNRSRLHPHCICYVAMSASSNALEASIPEFSVVKDGDVASSPSPLVKSKRSANRYLSTVGKPLLFASPIHLLF